MHMTAQQAPYRLLDPFIGTWKTAGLIAATANKPAVPVNGTDTYEWQSDGYFILHTVNVQMGEAKNESIEVIGYDAATNRYPMWSFSNNGETQLMHASFEKGKWTFLGKSLRFTGGFSEEGKVLSGIWEQTADGQNWQFLMDIKLHKIDK